MKRCLSFALFTVVSATAVCGRAQGTFQNLDFESAQVIYVDPPFNHVIATTNALPGWAAFSGTNQLSTIPYGPQGIFYPVMLYSQTNGGSISGFFNVLLDGGGSLAGSISQTGLVPSDAQSLIFKTGTGFGLFTVSIGGQELPYTIISTAPTYTLYGADIASFAGQTATLKFMRAGGDVMLDDIQFSPLAIPEPSSMALLGLCALSFAARRLRKRRGRA